MLELQRHEDTVMKITQTFEPLSHSMMRKIKSCVKVVVSSSEKFIYLLELQVLCKNKVACKKLNSDLHPLELLYENLRTN